MNLKEDKGKSSYFCELD